MWIIWSLRNFDYCPVPAITSLVVELYNTTIYVFHMWDTMGARWRMILVCVWCLGFAMTVGCISWSRHCLIMIFGCNGWLGCEWWILQSWKLIACIMNLFNMWGRIIISCRCCEHLGKKLKLAGYRYKTFGALFFKGKIVIFHS